MLASGGRDGGARGWWWCSVRSHRVLPIGTTGATASIGCGGSLRRSLRRSLRHGRRDLRHGRRDLRHGRRRPLAFSGASSTRGRKSGTRDRQAWRRRWRLTPRQQAAGRQRFVLVVLVVALLLLLELLLELLLLELLLLLRRRRTDGRASSGDEGRDRGSGWAGRSGHAASA